MVVRSSVAALLLILALIAIPAAAPTQAQSGERCFTETGQCINGEIRTFWERNGGLAVFGFPISPQQGIVGEDGLSRQTQSFERHRIELHPDQPAPYNVQLGRIGVERLGQQGRDWASFPPLDPNNADAENCRFFRETNHQVCGEFLTAFRRSGLSFPNTPGTTFAESLALFGLPLSEAMQETIDGKEYTVQWFERARFELHPENQPPFRVLFGRLGAEAGPGGVTATPLAGTTWELESYGNPAAPTPAASSPATMGFDTERVSGTTGCNSYGGPYQATGDTITFGPLVSTLRACAEPAIDGQEQMLLGALQGQVPYTLVGGKLRLTYDSGRQTLTFRAATPLVGTTWRLASFGATDAGEPAVADAQPATLTFEGERFAGTTGCNTFNGPYELTGTTITPGPVATTRALCTSDTLSRQERAILTAFSAPLSYLIVGDTLRLIATDRLQILTYNAVPQAAVTGTVTYLQRSALPPEAVIDVQLVDVSLADAPARVIASQRIVAGGRQVPFAFALPYDPATIDPRFTYAIQARITIDGRLSFISTQAYLVITGGNPTSDVEVVVQPV